MNKNPVESLARNSLLALWTIFALFPLFWMIVISFKSDAQMFNTIFAFDPTLENYQQVLLKTDYFKCFIDNLIVSGGAVIVSILVGVPAAYSLARFTFRSSSRPRFSSSSRCFSCTRRSGSTIRTSD